MSVLAERCPRLHRAAQAERVLLAARARREIEKRKQLARLEWLVEHREMQLLRAGATGNPKYFAYRARKLDTARAALEHVQGDLRDLATWEPPQEHAA